MAERIALTCPHDALALIDDGGTLRCASGHSFDVARIGYVNLLPVAHKASRAPGDSASMVAARRRVLDAGLFAPLSAALREHPAVVASVDAGDVVLDAGCGDGHHTATIAQRWPRARLLGIDISKPAIQVAARRHPSLQWVVASNRALPVAPGGVGLILCLFGFACWTAWAAHQRTGQCVLSVDPGADHLLELRERVYDDVRRKVCVSSEAARSAGYALQRDDRLTVTVAAPPLDALLEMTPHGRRVGPAARERLLVDAPQRMTIDVHVRQWRRTD